jgi:ABC-type multidrug transport system fused ATPase/permease subunit
MIELKKLTFSYESNPNVKIFSHFDFTIKKGDKVLVKGRSGIGKTSLYKLLTSAYPNIFSTIDKDFLVFFSPQHPLILPETKTI